MKHILFLYNFAQGLSLAIARSESSSPCTSAKTLQYCNRARMTRPLMQSLAIFKLLSIGARVRSTKSNLIIKNKTAKVK